jgi:ABC-type sugar transport system ATPase subunit
MRAARSRNSGGKRFDLVLMNPSYLSGRSVSTKPGAIQPGRKQNGRIRFAIGPFWQPVIALDGTTLLPPDRAVTLGIRPEDLVLTELKGDEVLNTTVLSVAFHGRSLRVQVEAADGQALFADIPREGEQARLVPGQAIGLALKKDVRPPVFMH